MKRIIFVGINNKPGMGPLDSRTRSGKLIDKTIEAIKDHSELSTNGPYEFKKTNLFDTEFKPEKYQPGSVIHEWRKRNDFNEETDIVIALGTEVTKCFSSYFKQRVIKAMHPAARRHRPHKEYSDNIVRLLKLELLNLPF